MDLFSLLFQELEKKDKEHMDEREKEILKRRWFDCIWVN